MSVDNIVEPTDYSVGKHSGMKDVERNCNELGCEHRLFCEIVQ